MSLYNRPICHAGRHGGTGIHLVLCLAVRETGSGRPSKGARGGLGSGGLLRRRMLLAQEKVPLAVLPSPSVTEMTLILTFQS